MRTLPLSLVALAACSAPAPEVHAFTSGADGFDTTTYWIDSGEEVVVFDTQFTPALAEQMLAEIEASTDSPVTTVVLTHPNPDKYNGAPVFQQAGATVIASQATADAIPGVHAYKKAYFVGAGMYTDDTYPAEATVDQTFDGELVLDLGNRLDLRLVELDQPGVSSTQTVASLPGALVVGDLVAGGVHAWLEGGIVDGVATPTLDGWRADLAQLAEIDPDATVYPGRGAAGPVGVVAAGQSAYLDGMQQLVADYVDGLEDPAAALGGAEAGEHYAAITAAAEEMVPEYGLSYLITYGVYGLAWQEAG